ncbi:LOW QUALITY PROTEIN: protein phosphatase 1 regulatory subunit 3E [Bombina bombina]|uniref:LOW QUALITY PROTEIN: protein phosphatase 1 regulatory subunit 3E n=1 Tax=Bombina bombina TaxID=8345 RepID=UPI00235A9392|nr:LOW QUALITY PROTEIN: protein phosphatase 1 regulatory subunit 3E [Bombina bombina]
MSRPVRPPSGDIPRNLSYIAGLYERAYYRTARPSLEEQEEEGEADGSAAARTGRELTTQVPRRWRSRSAPALRTPKKEQRHRSPETRKRVRFADALGLELESIRHFNYEDMPCVPLHVTHRLQREVKQRWGISQDESGWCEARHALSPSWQSERGMWEKHTWERPAWDKQTWDQRVSLQSMRCESCFLWGSVRVLDLAYEKRVIVRYSMDGWRTYHDTHALYAARLCHGGPGHPGTDLFTFRLPLPPQDRHQASSLQFAIRYQVGEEEFWDNNNGKNYSLGAPGEEQDHSENGWIHFI